MPEPEDTPGPWRASWSREGQSWLILNKDGHMIANAFESETNARLMAATWDMYKALQSIVKANDNFPGGAISPVLLEPICVAIAKAKGE